MRTPEQRAAHAAYVAKWRLGKIEREECLRCPNPVARDRKGRPRRHCQTHLDSDADRAEEAREARKAKS